MGWKDRAEKTNDWKSRAEPVAVDAPAPEERGFLRSEPGMSNIEKLKIFADELTNPMNVKPYAEGAVFAGIDKLQGNEEPYADLYRKYRDLGLEDREERFKKAPAAALGGTVVNALATPGGMGKSVASRVLSGAAIGAGGALGESKADLTKGEFGKAAMDVAPWTVGGGVLGKFTKPAVSAIKNAPEALEKSAAKSAYKIATGERGSSIADALARGDLEDKGAELLRKDQYGKPIVGWFSKTGAPETTEKLATKTKNIGEKLGDIRASADQVIPQGVDIKKISDDIVNETLGIHPTETHPDFKRVVDNMLKEGSDIENMGKMSVEEAVRLAQEMSPPPRKSIFAPVTKREEVLGKQNMSKIAKIIKGNTQDAISEASKIGDSAYDVKTQKPLGDLLKEYDGLEKKYAVHKKLQQYVDLARAADEKGSLKDSIGLVPKLALSTLLAGGAGTNEYRKSNDITKAFINALIFGVPAYGATTYLGNRLPSTLAHLKQGASKALPMTGVPKAAAVAEKTNIPAALLRYFQTPDEED